MRSERRTLRCPFHLTNRVSGPVGAEALGIRNLPDAEAMERSGASRIDIWRETGWWRGKDGQWRVEIPDFELLADAPRN